MNEATGRGGAQRIPRPSSFRHGDPPPWVDLPDELRRVDLALVRAACATLPEPRDGFGAIVDSRPAAVLVPIFEEDGEARVILTKRPETMPSHQGEIAFPGGKYEAGDVDLRATALREAQEEIGLDPGLVEIVGELDHLVTVAARFTLAPFVGLLPERPVLVPHVREVDAVFDVAISELLHDDVFREERWEVPPEMLVGVGPDRAIHFFELAGETVWGATARILTGFLAHLTATAAEGPGPGAAGVS
ncbi:MAG: CoA pyrophosphatase [Acidimicrobiia bacterium]|jgi:8-oxo-dGTP pyrophosphatase MutT (NUDIX family)